MNIASEKQIRAFVGILKNMGLTKDDIMGVGAFVEDNLDMMDEILIRLQENNFKTTPRETMNIIGQVIEENQ